MRNLVETIDKNAKTNEPFCKDVKNANDKLVLYAELAKQIFNVEYEQIDPDIHVYLESVPKNTITTSSRDIKVEIDKLKAEIEQAVIRPPEELITRNHERLVSLARNFRRHKQYEIVSKVKEYSIKCENLLEQQNTWIEAKKRILQNAVQLEENLQGLEPWD